METEAAWNDKLLRLLAGIYGEGPAVSALQAIRSLPELRQLRPRPAFPGFDRREALLIAYADMVGSDGHSPLSALHGFVRKHLRGLVSGAHLLPFYPSSSDDGFSVMDYHAVDPDLGTWDDVSALARDFDLMADAVLNHASARGRWFREFLSGHPPWDRFFLTLQGGEDLSRVVRPRTHPLVTRFNARGGPRDVWTTFSADQVDLNYAEPAVLVAMLEVLLDYVARGARYLRLDAVGFLWKQPGTGCLHLPQTHALVRVIRMVLEAVDPGVRLVTETNVPHADNIAYFGEGNDEAHMVYNFALPPLILHTLRAGEARKLTRWARSLATPGPRTAFFNFLASHDGIGVTPVRDLLEEGEIGALVEAARRAGGHVSCKSVPGGEVPYELNVNYLDVLGADVDAATAEARFLCAHAMALALAGVPGLYFHSLFGSIGDPAGAARSGIPRRINREKLEAPQLERELADRCSRRSRIFGRLAALLRLRSAAEAFSPSSPQEILEAGPSVFAVLRGTGAGRRLCLHEVSGRGAELEMAGAWQWPDGRPWRGVLPPYGVAWLAPA